MARTRALLDAGRLPARADDDRTLARMLGVALLTGLAMTGGTIYGLVHLLT